MPRWCLLLLFGLLGIVLPPQGVRAVDHQGFARQRLIHRFDFDERDEGNFEALPMFWYPIGRAADNIDPNFLRQPLHQELAARTGFPSWGDVRFDDTQQTSGQHSFYLGLNGGSVGAYLAVGAVPAVPGSDYVITASVRTTALQYAQARLVAYFIDHRGQAIDASRAAGSPTPTADTWQTVSVKLLGDFPHAAWIGLQVELLQPQHDPQHPLGKHQLVLPEVRGGAWFDDIAIWQSPNVTVNTQSPVNVLREPHRPRLSMAVRDLTGRALEARVAIYDHTLQMVSEMRTVVGDGAPVQWQWTPPLERFGWYLVDMAVRERDAAPGLAAPVARTASALLWLPEDALHTTDDQNAFGLMCEDLPDEELALVPQLLAASGIRRVTLSGWSTYTDRDNIDARQSLLDQVLQAILISGREAALSLSPVPQTLQRQVNVEDGSVLPLFAAPVQDWIDYLAPVVLRHGQRVASWQVGSPHRPAAFYVPQMPALANTAEHAFRNLAPQPTVILAWSLLQARRADAPAGNVYLMDVPYQMNPQRIVQAMEPWRQAPAPQVRLHLEPWDAVTLSHSSRISDLAQRMIYAWEAGAHGLEISSPWTTQASRRLSLLPDPLLGVYSEVSHRLAGRRIVGRLHIADGVECIILNGSAGGAMVAWNRHAEPKDALLDMYLGPQPVAIDVWGNRTPLPIRKGHHRVVLSHTPLFIEGIDPELALFRAAFKLEPRFIESLQVPHERSVTLFNPWQRTISGHMLVMEPGDWQISPKKHYFSIAAGQTTQVPMQLMFPASEVAGMKRLRVRFDFLAHQRYEVDVTAPMELGLRDVEFTATLAQEVDPQTGTRDAVVTQLITNQGKKEVALYAFASMPNFPGQVRIVSQLKPGQSIVRRFRFTNGADQLDENTAVRVGLRETDGPAVLNRVLRMNQR